MSRIYRCWVEVTGYQKNNDIEGVLSAFGDNGENYHGDPLRLVGDVSLRGGESEEEFCKRLAERIWSADNTTTHICTEEEEYDEIVAYSQAKISIGLVYIDEPTTFNFEPESKESREKTAEKKLLDVVKAHKQAFATLEIVNPALAKLIKADREKE